MLCPVEALTEETAETPTRCSTPTPATPVTDTDRTPRATMDAIRAPDMHPMPADMDATPVAEIAAAVEMAGAAVAVAAVVAAADSLGWHRNAARHNHCSGKGDESSREYEAESV